jgi:hypothetical protein
MLDGSKNLSSPKTGTAPGDALGTQEELGNWDFKRVSGLVVGRVARTLSMS